MSTLRPAAVAGSFYPGDAAILTRDLNTYFDAVPPAPTFAAPKALIVPHAGYIYSGATAAAAYARLKPLAGHIRRVVLLGPCHRVAVRGMAVPSVDRFATPLGEIPLDRAAIDSLADLPQVVVNDAAHAQEHSLEVQLPFLQSVLGSFSLIPLAVGQSNAGEVAQVLDRLWDGDDTLILISSDLSHFHPYAEAKQIDGKTVADILALRPLTHFEQACGALPINGVLEIARQRGLTIELVAQCNSGDTAGDKSRVVGYASFALTDSLGPALLARARNAISAKLGQAAQTEPSNPALAHPGATFVTLTQNGALRGCIGSLEAHRALDTDVRENGLAAAFRDPRFPPLTLEELARTRVEVSLLTPPQAMSFKDEADALSQLRPLQDGVIFIAGNRRSTFLPQVWEQLPDRKVFMSHLKQKAGLPADFWSPDVKLLRYQVRKWKEA
jgi:AmmeMemoRadiSam system protein B/AmmeMemoRadiSam system protein A